MAYAFTLNGVGIPVTAGTRQAPRVIGGENGFLSAFSGRLLRNERGRKERWSFTSPPTVQADAQALRGLVAGLGHSWSYNTDLYSDGKGLGPSLSTGCSVVATGKYGSRLRITAGNKLQYTISGDSSKWTLLYWKQALEVDGEVWEHFIVRGDGTKYKAGATTTADTWSSYNGTTLKLQSAADFYPAWVTATSYPSGTLIRGGTALDIFSSSGGTSGAGPVDFDSAPNEGDPVTDNGITWTNVGDGWAHFDDVVFLPYLIPASWVSQLYTEANARAFTALPSLRMAGDLVTNLPNGVVTVQGELGDAALAQFQSGGTWQDNGEVLDFSLYEV